MDYKIKLRIGDWSNDGHGKTSSYNIESNLTSEDLNKAYNNGKEIVGFDFIHKVCVEYEDRSIKKEYVDLLIERGYDGPNFMNWRGEMEYSLDEDIYFDIYLFICRLGNPNLRWQNYNFNGTLDIGGYGLFY